MKLVGELILCSLGTFISSILILATTYVIYLCIMMVKLCKIEVKTKISAKDPEKVRKWLEGKTLFGEDNEND